MHPFMTVCFHFLHFLDGSTKKKQAEQQAAKVALQHLSGILSSLPVSATEKNFKGVLKERLDQVGFKNPIYETEESKAETSEEPVTSGMSPNLSNCEFNLKEMSKNPCIFTSKKTVTYQVLESKGFLLFAVSISQAAVKEHLNLKSEAAPHQHSSHQTKSQSMFLFLCSLQTPALQPHWGKSPGLNVQVMEHVGTKMMCYCRRH